ncbi:4-amino-4-deoxy-L-arabinose-phosphoundecaprenol flippase subunit ArnF [Salinisphaera sp. LB1]|uniref:4-amino-4-deoxy-L-arabinose-phosphoundecaprenol flippase subunit ArnF n=1 Tax=Salinisphaera sp. LB1 TaxID=2183911 RepID=UPI000D70526A|nr:4-amino-4-deoxy-L-arabinose-phosphoundecaprenol flippase subunit ArnF [Salinisphaera sp. LB1]
MSRAGVVTGFQLAGASIALVTYAQLAQKWGMAHLPPLHYAAWVGADSAAWAEALFFVASGLLAYLVSMACWMGALAYLPLNRAYPLLGLSYALVYLAGAALPWYPDTISARGVLGVGLIGAGVVLINLRRSPRDMP